MSYRTRAVVKRKEWAQGWVPASPNGIANTLGGKLDELGCASLAVHESVPKPGRSATCPRPGREALDIHDRELQVTCCHAAPDERRRGSGINGRVVDDEGLDRAEVAELGPHLSDGSFI